MISKLTSNKRFKDFLFILWAGGTALLTYSLIYTLRKPFTAALYSDLELWGIDYKVMVTTIQIVGYLIAKFFGIKIISELKRADRFKFFAVSVVMAELSLVAFGMLPVPYNALAMFFNGLSLGCMWGVIFSFIEGRRVTDLLASLLGVSMVFSSGVAKSMGLYVMNELNIDQFWMPAFIGAIALPLLFLMAYSLIKLPHPDHEDIKHKSERSAIDATERKKIFRRYTAILTLILAANFVIVMLRDIKEDFLVNIIDMQGQSSWMFAQVDTIITLIILGLFAVMTFVRKNIAVLVVMLILVVLSMGVMSYISFNYQVLDLSPMVWLFAQSLPLYIAYLTFQTIFFDRFIACFRIKGNVGYFIALIDFVGYAGTVFILFMKEAFSVDVNWFEMYNQMSALVGSISVVVFSAALYFLIRSYRRENGVVAAKTSVVKNIEGKKEINVQVKSGCPVLSTLSN